MRYLVVLALLSLPAPDAQAGLDLAWDECATTGGVQDVAFACSDYYAWRTLYATVVMPVTIEDFLRLDFVLDLQVDAAELPPFWDFAHPVSNPLGCNPGWIFGPQRIPTGSCAGTTLVWNTCPNDPAGPVTNVAYYARSGAANRGRFVGYNNRVCGTRVDQGTLLFAFHLELYSALAEYCPGCTTPATIVWNEAVLTGVTGDPVSVTGPGMGSNCVTVNGSAIPCGATPARRSTWGALKSLYR